MSQKIHLQSWAGSHRGVRCYATAPISWDSAAPRLFLQIARLGGAGILCQKCLARLAETEPGLLQQIEQGEVIPKEPAP